METKTERKGNLEDFCGEEKPSCQDGSSQSGGDFNREHQLKVRTSMGIERAEEKKKNQVIGGGKKMGSGLGAKHGVAARRRIRE